MYTQSRTKAVPYGFICGYPVAGVSSELYGYYEGQGGKAGAQGAAVVAAMRKWGENEAGTAGGTELGFPVCKRGFKPFGEDGERLSGARKHHAARAEAMASKPPRGSASNPDGHYRAPGGSRSTSGCSARSRRSLGRPRRRTRRRPRRRSSTTDDNADDGPRRRRPRPPRRQSPPSSQGCKAPPKGRSRPAVAATA